MKPLFVLLAVFALTLILQKIIWHAFNVPLAARIALSAMLLFTAMAHFAFTKGMVMMVPNFIPYKPAVVYLTGIIEMTAAIGLLLPGLRIWTGWLLILFFILILPANIQAAIQQIDYQKGTYTGSGLAYLWFRIPLQLLFIGWTYFSAIKF